MSSLTYFGSVTSVFAVLLLVACLGPKDDSGGGSGAPVSDTGMEGGDAGGDTGVSDAGTDSTQTSGNFECHFEPPDEECLGCMTSYCGSEIFTTYGSYGMPTVPGGACADFMICVDGCDCEDWECTLGCFSSISDACSSAMGALETCLESNCAVACEGEDEVETELAICGQVDGALSIGVPYNGSFTAGSRSSGGPMRGSAYYEVLTLTIPSGVQVSITQVSEDLDSYLFLLDNQCRVVDSNDDYQGMGFNSRIDWTGSTTSSSYYVVPSSFDGMETGAFQVLVSYAE